MDDRFQQMLAEFRALGGTAENIRLGEGAFGRGIFPVDPAKPVAVAVPENLLMDVSDLRIEGGAFRVAQGSSLGAAERRFVEEYEASFSWGNGRGDIEALFEQAQALPAEIRHQLRVEFRCGEWFAEPDAHTVEERFFSSRSILYGKRNVIMPVVELINHGDAAGYDTSSGVSVRGTFAGEVNVRYSDVDAYGLFLNWGFSHPQRQALSLALSGAVGGKGLHIERDYTSGEAMPTLKRDGDALALNYLMLGHRQYPRLAKGIFYKRMREAGANGIEEAFDTIQHINRMNFLGVMALLEPFEGAMVRGLRRMARHQLEALSFACGVRPV
ncbi:MAG: hypothetical protein JO261_04785 [Alphaproteobacteria bacterium]|nr:hypothetical protein [Alphaproteobacteria bacterium]